MSEEKIINGIDVSECRYLNKVVNEEPYCNADEEHLYTCSSDENCYFKQFKRLQKENEGLKSLNDFNVQKIEVLQEENEQLKARLKTLDDEVLTIEITPDEFERYKKYKQALEQIRKEITPVCSYCSNIDGFSTWEDCENVCEKGVIKYLKIIDEVLNEQK